MATLSLMKLSRSVSNLSNDDIAVVSASFIYGLIMAMLLLVQYVLSDTYSVLPFFCLLVFFCHLLKIRRSMSDPFTIMLLFAFIYAAFPLLFGQPNSWASLHFDFDGAALIYAVGSVAMILGIGLSTALIRENRSQRRRMLDGGYDRTAYVAGVLLSTFSLLLTTIFVVKQGTVVLGGHSYAQSFQIHLEEGMGIFNLAVPMAAGGVALMIASNFPLKPYHHCLAVVPYFALFVAQGQRKYLIIPAIFYFARYVKFNSWTRILALLAVCVVGFVFFMYLGFIRGNGYTFAQLLTPSAIDDFLKHGGQAFGGETVPVYATASSAYKGFVAPLPQAGDYLKSWMICLPNFLFRTPPFQSLNSRFSLAYNPRFQYEGGGWGFSFFGEAYLIGGYLMIVVAVFAIMLLFRWLYVSGGRDLRRGPMGAISLAALPFTFWFQRNSFALFLKEFLVLQVIIILFAYHATAFALIQRRVRSSKLRPANEVPY